VKQHGPAIFCDLDGRLPELGFLKVRLNDLKLGLRERQLRRFRVERAERTGVFVGLSFAFAIPADAVVSMPVRTVRAPRAGPGNF
jgi:hypothetical protein